MAAFEEVGLESCNNGWIGSRRSVRQRERRETPPSAFIEGANRRYQPLEGAHPVGEIRKEAQAIESFVEACRDPRATVNRVGRSLQQEYVQPFKDGNMRGAGRATGKTTITGLENYRLQAWLQRSSGLSSNGGEDETWAKCVLVSQPERPLEKAISVAPDWIPDALANPKKAAHFQSFLNNPGSKEGFGFRFPIDKNVGRGVSKGVDGTVQRLRGYKSVYVEYAWHPGKAGTWEIKLKTIYPRRD